MAYIARSIADVKAKANGQRHYGESQECVAAVKHFCNARQTALWRKGKQVKGDTTILPGTAIATFTAANGGYRGHAAIYTGQDSSGLQVLDQWKNREFKPRTIYFGRPTVSNNGDLFYVVD